MTEALDAIDLKILRALLRAGDIPNNQLAERVGLTPGPCSRRVARLKEAGVIQRHTVMLDAKALGYGLLAFVEVTMDRHGGNFGPRFAEAMRRKPEVVECHVVAGDYDFLLKVAARDMKDYQRLVWEDLNAIEGVRTVRSVIVIDTVKDEPGPAP